MSLLDALNLSQGIGLDGAIVTILLKVLVTSLGGPLCVVTPLVEHVLHVLVKLGHLGIASYLVHRGEMSANFTQAGQS